MLSRTAKLALVATSFAPICITVAFILAYRKEWIPAAWWLGSAGACVVVCAALLFACRRKLETFAFPVSSIKNADKEIVGFVIAYLLPLATTTPFKYDPAILIFVIALFFVVVVFSNTYHFNPLIGVLGYHFYEASSANVSYVLITRKDLRRSITIKRVVMLTEYMVLDAD